MVACNNDKKTNDHKGHTGEEPKTRADSLMADVMDGHDVGMAKYGKLKTMQAETLRLLDSIAKLPAKARQAAAPLKTKLDGLLADLQSAKDGMDKWMSEFNMDSALDNMEQRIKYLAEEKLKVSKVKESILTGLQKADSLLKAKL
jgi:hypothetical protein